MALGIFREPILQYTTEIIESNISTSINTGINKLISKYGSGKKASAWIAHYIVYYPCYLAGHFLLIHMLFLKEKRIKTLLIKGLLVLLTLLITGKILFGALNIELLEDYFSFAFHKLIALPFLLLVIEGGRYFYKLIDNSDKIQ